MKAEDIRAEENILHLADAASIVQANQKDTQIETILNGKLNDLLTLTKGQLFTNIYSKHISIASKLLYLSLTTLIGRKTLGEEYVDIFIVNKKNKGLVKRYQRLVFIIGYTLGPYLLQKLLSLWKRHHQILNEDDDHDDSNNDGQLSWEAITNSLLDIHMLIFYFKGAYYDMSRRVSGLRYVTGHHLTNDEKRIRERNSKTYKVLGSVLLLQSLSNYIPLVKYLGQLLTNSIFKHNYRDTNIKSSDQTRINEKIGIIKGVPEESKYHHIDLSDGNCFKFIPESSRKCILCLSDISDPSSAPCGHIYCWKCIINWCTEKEECPLCRQICKPQQVIPLR
ncbi:similar to Saccharomyces cerevisiae YDR265W PEX10 Peroxisomal membrane E3 ubiquitin ligase, required for for Ubc4p-dependent Pex5p ubiquitination and peroxisomal matrix protein import [Maudiozyma barnettii]|uniref:RING-type E3 ubiquitin transferase n=1 Tax=Maudiozyma barnettii TaxID=61262 RepID=A0A8H2VIH7_9SACH|nr:ubiquitin-protein ligase peroxin 10 [Kazachstania barnettii]CAB4256015.1 similar to Saccharomyces cerevisiae YDR265W PEX10 Peroxisomal membrane E3 ubiquitin ligase, required for for Ubc4p-dependent Pex5p ubiquitination and peroxisomal matrix protein import [Kazachstania barnettii]CAD1784623.1 similar to Saccharomyces cerevisiae YDR265W PEX10 Peroxisomal membrane E3 ubiquitin ligase, required for for Ubc4p-dependent Pex5p ubiquitination and peroxisomal matrix protein import [Kazachstania barnet